MIIPPGYAAAQQITVTATTGVTGSTSVPSTSSSDYVVRVYASGAAAGLIYRYLQDQANGSDLTVWWEAGGVPVQLDADIETVSPAAISVWFKLQAPIAPGGSDQNYVLAYGSASPVVLRRWANIYNLSDDFGGLDATKWTAYNGVIVSFPDSTTIRLDNSTTLDIAHNNNALQSVTLFGAGYAIRGRGTMPVPTILNNPHIFNSLRFVNGDSSQLPGGTLRCDAILFVDPANAANVTPNYPSDWVVVSFDDDGSGQFGTIGDLQAADGLVHTFNLGRAPSSGDAYAWIDEQAVVHTSSQSCTTSGHVWLAPSGDNIPNIAHQTWDFVKVRPFVAAEPVTSLGLQQFAHDLVAWPFA